MEMIDDSYRTKDSRSDPKLMKFMGEMLKLCNLNVLLTTGKQNEPKKKEIPLHVLQHLAFAQ
jgi:hypothetical protein